MKQCVELIGEDYKKQHYPDGYFSALTAVSSSITD